MALLDSFGGFDALPDPCSVACSLPVGAAVDDPSATVTTRVGWPASAEAPTSTPTAIATATTAAQRAPRVVPSSNRPSTSASRSSDPSSVARAMSLPAGSWRPGRAAATMTTVEPTEQVRRVVATFDALADDYDQGGVAYFGPIADRLLAAVPDGSLVVEQTIRVTTARRG